MIVILIYVSKEAIESKKTQVILLRKTLAQQNQKAGDIVSLFRREYGSVGVAWRLIIRVVLSTPPVIHNNWFMKEN